MELGKLAANQSVMMSPETPGEDLDSEARQTEQVRAAVEEECAQEQKTKKDSTILKWNEWIRRLEKKRMERWIQEIEHDEMCKFALCPCRGTDKHFE